MIVVRDDQQRLLLHSAIALDPQRLSELEGLGALTWLVVPNGHHRLDAPAYKAHYPSLTVICPSGAARRVRRVVAVDRTYEEFPANAVIHVHLPPWPTALEGVIEARDDEGTTLVFNDLLFVPPRVGLSALPYRWLRQGAQVPWLAKRTLAPDRGELREWLLQLAQIDQLMCIVPGHGDPITEDAPAALRAIAAAV